MISFDDFRQRYPIGSRVGDDSLVVSGEETHDTKYQCVSYVKAYLRDCFEIYAGAWGHAIDYWTSTNSSLLGRFARIGNSDAQKGDVVMLWGLPGNNYGHIGIATGVQTGGQVEILEQNGSSGNGRGQAGDAIRTRLIDKSRIAGLLRPIAVSAPARTPAEYIQYTAVPHKVMRTTKSPTNWWHLSNDSADINNFRTATTLNHHTDFPIGGYAVNRHFPHYTYAMTPDDFTRAINGDYSTNNGVNLNDLEDKPAPVYVPPAAPVPITKADKYTLITMVEFFKTADNAKRRHKPIGPLGEGEYFLIKKDEQAYLVSKDNKTDIGWVNVHDNKIEKPAPLPEPAQPTLPVDAPPTDITIPVDTGTPVVIEPSPEPVNKPQYLWLNDDRSPITMTSTNVSPMKIKDLEGKWPATDFPARRTEEFSMYAIVGKTEYWLPDKSRKQGYMFGINVDMLKPVATFPDFDRDGQNDLVEISDFILTPVTRTWQTMQKFMTSQKVVEATKKIGKSIDGFRRPK